MTGRMARALVLVMIVLAAVAPAWTARAQGPTTEPVHVSAELSSDRVYVGDSVDLTVLVDGSNSPDRPTLRLPEGLSAEFAGGTDRTSHFVAVINGKREERSTLGYSFQFRVAPSRPGTFTIPGIDVVVGGKVYTTDPVTITAAQAGQASGFALKAGVEKRQLYVGEPVRLKIVWMLANNVRNISFSKMPGLEEFDVATPRDRVPTGARRDENTVEFPLFERPVVGTWSDEDMGGKRLRALTVEQVIVPRAAGTHVLGPLSVAFDEVLGGRRGVFDFFEDRSPARRVAVASEPITIDVKELPASGRPADFGGLVGAYSLMLTVEPKSVSVGDPITLKLIADGPDPMERLEVPELSAVAGFDRFKLSSDGWKSDSGSLPGRRALSTTVRVSDAKVTEVPAISIPYFDPADGVYKRATAGPVAIKVRPAREVTAADAVGAQPRMTAPAAGPGAALESAGPGLVANTSDDSVLRDEGGDLASALRSPLTITVLVLPPLAFGAVLGVRVRREWSGRADRAVARTRRRVERALRRAGDGTAVADALKEYAGVVLAMPARAVTPIDCRAAAGSHAGLGAVAEVLAACERDRFGDGGVSTAALAERARAALLSGTEPRSGRA